MRKQNRLKAMVIRHVLFDVRLRQDLNWAFRMSYCVCRVDYSSSNTLFPTENTTHVSLIAIFHLCNNASLDPSFFPFSSYITFSLRSFYGFREPHRKIKFSASSLSEITWPCAWGKVKY